MPKVSVLVPLFHTEPEHFRAMVDSVLAQTFTDFELLLLNDSPEDASLREMVALYDDPRIRFEENEKNLGISAARNRLIDMARGEYLAILDHDDIAFPDRLEKEVAYLDEHPEVGVVSGATVVLPGEKVDHYPEENLAIKRAMMTGCPLVHSAAMIRRSALEASGIRYKALYSPAEDYVLWIRLMGVTMFHNFAEPLIYYRNHTHNTTHLQAEAMEDATLRARSLLAREFPLFVPGNAQRQWIYLFDAIPLIKVKMRGKKKLYLLFGVIPLWSVKA